MSEDQSQAQLPITPADPVAEAPSDELSLPSPLILAAIGLVLLSVITFLPTLRGQVTWLDDVSLTDNPFVQATDGVARFWTSADRVGRYQPLTLTSFWLGVRLFHDSLIGAHFVNILLHAGVVILLWALLRRLSIPGAWFAAAAFAVHPVHTQAVAWLSGRSVVLASVFYLAAMLVYLRFLGLTPAAEKKTLLTLPPEPERLWGLALVLFICALASNAAASITLPIAILIILWWKRMVITAWEWLGLVPFFIAAIAGGIWVGWLQEISLANGVLRAAFGFTPMMDRLLIGTRAVWFYACKIIVPHPLIFDYPRWQASAAIGALCGLVIVAVLLGLWIATRRIGRAPLAAAILFVITLTPMLGLLDPPAIRYSFVADDRQYLASAALIVLIAALAAQAVTSEKLQQLLNPAYCAGAVLVVLAVLTFHAGTFYLSNEKLWSHTISNNRQSLLGDEEYADSLLSAGHFDPARQWFEKAQLLAPTDPRAAVGLGTVAAAVGYDDQSSGHPELTAAQQTSAQQYFDTAIHLDPNFKPAYVAKARLLEWKKDKNGAIDALTQAVRIEPQAFRTRLDLGSTLRSVGRLKEAEDVLTELAEDAPNSSAVHSELGNVYIEQHSVTPALDEWQKALLLDPANTAVMLNFGALLDSSGDTDLAAKQFLAATMVDPSLLQAHIDLARVYTKLGHRHDAVLQLTQAIELDPTNSATQTALAKAIDDEKKNGPGTPASSQPATDPTAIGDSDKTLSIPITKQIGP